MKQRSILLVSSVLWLFSVVAGLRVMLTYENTPGISATAPVQWPANSGLRRAPAGATLVMLVHPQCPCTRASIGELNALMAQCQGKVSVYVLFFKPKGMAAGWEKTDLWQSAAAIPGVKVVCDDGGAEARRFGVATSGQAMLFDSAGHLLFSGGITGGRGHSGDNAGRSAIVSLVTAGTTERDKTFVFGCSVLDPASIRSGVK